MWAELSDVSYVKKTQDRTSETSTISRSDLAKIPQDAENSTRSYKIGIICREGAKKQPTRYGYHNHVG